MSRYLTVLPSSSLAIRALILAIRGSGAVAGLGWGRG